ncbi:3D domain-containing protein [Paenibacillus polymyxa]|uniref:3D domain-containing protein n=1 Tax=Paenibacillus polymyxa TaxID=1406 RepID=UPI002AB35502|nr:3D domain-containing protein [Paenibacillus polymyxa]MDY8021172.1 3D domain-containing protein [Paenibacillus polymyxa]
MGELILSLLLTLSVFNTELQSVSQAREMKNTTIIKQETKVAKLDKVEQVKHKQDTYKRERFELTAYTNNQGRSVHSKDYGRTASGKMTKAGETIAADWRVLPKGTVVYIDGIGRRVVQDKGRAIKGHRIDVYVRTEHEAVQFGRKKHVKVRVIKWGDNK